MEYTPFIKVLANDVEVSPYSINENVNLYDKTDICGANVFYGSNNTIIFVLNSKYTCEIKLLVTKAIAGSMRFNTIEDLFDSSKFIDNICSYLGIATN